MLFVCVSCSPDETGREGAMSQGRSEPTISLFALGDTGHPWGAFPRLFEGQLAVGDAMQREHARSPVQALILLGDNFYPDGLLKEEILLRIADNLATPYCAFIDPSPALSEVIRDRCRRPRAGKTSLKIYAVTGNHDLASPGSLDLQRTEIPLYIRNWEVPVKDEPEVRELDGGLSLIFIDSAGPWGDVEARLLASALERSRGPWRLVIGHRPPIDGHPGLSQMVARASKESGRIIHAYLAGHVHALGAIRGTLPSPALTLIAGSGSRARLHDATEYRVDSADLLEEELGFLRVDVFENDTPSRLAVTLYSTPRSSMLSFLGTTAIACYGVSLEGSVTVEDCSETSARRPLH